MSYVKTKSKQKPFRVSAFKKIDEKISFALPKYGSSRFVFRFFGSLECSRLRNSFCPPDPSPPQAGEDRIPFELFQEYTASWNFARKKAQPRGAKRAARLGFERAFWAKRKRIYQ